jgi:NAD(P)-dependent dehydrogenase (short-subunit alcohol dehydrogenase family)
MKELNNKNCLITGAASGIGRSFALALAKEGMNLYITDINVEGLEKVKNEIEELGAKVYSDRCDVSKFEDFKTISKDFYSKLGDLDLLINNAGIAIGGGIENLEIEDWERVLGVNLWSIIYSLKVFVPRMIEKGSGHIVNVSSGSGLFANVFEPLPYITSKFAVVGLSEALFSRLKTYGINVSVICPTVIKTNIWNAAEIKLPPKLLEDYGKEKIENLYRKLTKGISNSGMSADRAVKKYISGIKKNQLYIFDNGSLLEILSLKGRDLHEFEKFLVGYRETSTKNMLDFFHKHGINIEDYR